MEAGVAEAAADRCAQAADEIKQWLAEAAVLAQKLPFGNNEDGYRAADRFAQAGEEFITAMRSAQQVVEDMAVTFRAAGRMAAEADAASEQIFRGRSG